MEGAWDPEWLLEYEPQPCTCLDQVYYTLVIGSSSIVSRCATDTFEMIYSCSTANSMLTDTRKDTNRAQTGWNLGIHDFSSSLAYDMNLEKFLSLFKKKKKDLLIEPLKSLTIIGFGLCYFLQQDFIFERLYNSSQ